MVRTFWIFTLVVVLASCGGESSRSPATENESGSGGSGSVGETGGSGGTGGTGESGGSSSGGSSSGATGGATATGGNPATGGTAGVPPSCDNGVARNSDDERVIGIALEASSLAPPDRMVSIGVSLVDPGFEFERFQSANDEERQALIAEREAQLAPTQDAIAERVLALGGEIVSRLWLVNVVDVRLEARHMNEVPCWPDVVRIDLGDSYWEVADPPWDPNGLGEDECPRDGAACTAHCGQIRGSCLDAATGCVKPPEILACSRYENLLTDGFSACGVRSDTGELCIFGNFVPSEPGYVGWVPCTEEQANGVFAALPCGM